MKDPILEDLHATRERMLAESGGTLEGLVLRLQKEQSESGRLLWEPRRTLQGLDSAEKAGRDLRPGGSTPATR